VDNFRDDQSEPTSGRSRFVPVNVHVLSEHIFCPRAALLAHESGEDTGDEEPRLGPRLDGFEDYSEHQFTEELLKAWNDFLRWFIHVAVALLLVLGVLKYVSVFWAAIASFLLMLFALEAWAALERIVAVRREWALFRAAPKTTIDLAPRSHYTINWWTLRKAGFDCSKPAEPYPDHEERLYGKPWRILTLTKDTTLRIPVVRKHRGEHKWGEQHVARAVAYCHLLKVCERADAPFGVLMFAGCYECVVIPNTSRVQFKFRNDLEDARQFVAKVEREGYEPPAPNDNRCNGCHQGKPRRYVPGQSETVLNGQTRTPVLTRARNGKHYHSNCQDRFEDAPPPHKDAVRLGIALPRS